MTQNPNRPAHALRGAGLTRDRVLGAAVGLADEGGLDALSMRKLAKRLGVEAMSLYNHVGSKERLVAGMVDHVLGEIAQPSPDGDWKEEMRESAISTRAALNHHRWAVGRMGARGLPDAALGCLRAAGFSPEEATRACSVYDSYVHGFALREGAGGDDDGFLSGLDLILNALESRRKMIDR